MANTTNFNWETPDDTDLVKDGAAAIRTLGSAIDTSLVDLKGGTTGQILSKATNTDMDFTWITNDVGDITEVVASSPITGGGSSGSITVGIQDGTTAQKGAVQLEDSTSSTSTTKAATPASVKSAYDLADAAVAKSLVDAKGDLFVGSGDNAVARLAVGTNDYVLTADSTATNGVKWAAAAGGLNCAVFLDKKTSTAGGTFTSGAWRTRDINTSQFNNITGASIASNQITLPSGTFMVVATAPFQRVDQNALRFQNITDTSTAIEGQNAYTDTGVAVVGMAYLSGTFTIAASKTFELQHRCFTTRASDGFGASNTFTSDVYAVVSIWKVG